MKQVNEKDWKLFRTRVPDWQEAYMGKLVEEYKALLNESEPASGKFWALWERLKRDKRSPGVMLEDMSRSTMRMNLLLLLRHEIITIQDLDGFSDELREDLSYVVESWTWEKDEK